MTLLILAGVWQFVVWTCRLGLWLFDQLVEITREGRY